MIVYIYDKRTKEFLYPYTPQKNPKNPEMYLLPNNSTTKAPPRKEGFIARFEDDDWVLEKDFRGKEVIKSKLKELDLKRVRAICEPSLKNQNQSWLEYYNEQIQELRRQLEEL